MNTYQINHMIIDDDFYGEETITADFTHESRDYSISFHKSDFELINAWYIEGEQSVPANLPEGLIENIREDVKNRI